jgi:hypothetical protein
MAKENFDMSIGAQRDRYKKSYVGNLTLAVVFSAIAAAAAMDVILDPSDPVDQKIKVLVQKQIQQEKSSDEALLLEKVIQAGKAGDSGVITFGFNNNSITISPKDIVAKAREDAEATKKQKFFAIGGLLLMSPIMVGRAFHDRKMLKTLGQDLT